MHAPFDDLLGGRCVKEGKICWNVVFDGNVLVTHTLGADPLRLPHFCACMRLHGSSDVTYQRKRVTTGEHICDEGESAV